MDAIGDAIRGSLEGMEGRDADPNTPLSADGGDEGGDSGGEASSSETNTSGTSGVDGNAQGAKPKATAAKVAEVQDKLAEELGLDPTKIKDNNPIPYHRVRKITSKREADVAAKVAKLLGLDETAAAAVTYDKLDEVFDTHYTKKNATRETEYQRLEGESKTWKHIENLATNHPEKYLEELAVRIPFYRKFVLGGRNEAASQQTQQTQQAVDEDYPEPDVPLNNGDATYSVQGLQKYVGVAVNRALKEARAELAALRKEYEPIVKEHKGRQVSQQVEDKIVRHVEYLKKNREGFAENEAEILQHLMENRSKYPSGIEGINEAYNAVYTAKTKKRLADLEKAAADAKEAGRQEALEEIKKAKPITTSVGSTAGDEKDTGPVRTADPLGDAIRKSIAGLKR